MVLGEEVTERSRVLRIDSVEQDQSECRGEENLSRAPQGDFPGACQRGNLLFSNDEKPALGLEPRTGGVRPMPRRDQLSRIGVIDDPGPTRQCQKALDTKPNARGVVRLPRLVTLNRDPSLKGAEARMQLFDRCTQGTVSNRSTSAAIPRRLRSGSGIPAIGFMSDKIVRFDTTDFLCSAERVA